MTTNTVIHYHANIHTALNYALKNNLITRNPADIVDRPKKVEFVGSFYNNEEVNPLFEKVKGQLIELAVILAAFYGLRRSEIIGLKWTVIDLINKTISIKHTVTPVYFEGKEHIIERMGQRVKPGYVTQNFTRTLKKHNFRHIRFHDLRHSCASLLLANGVSMKEVQEWLGHSNYNTTANTMDGVLNFSN